MAQKVPQNRLNSGGIGFVKGINSFLNPSLLDQDQLSWGINVITKGGEINSRPKYNRIFNFGIGRAQGMASFTPTNGIPHLVFVIDGLVYASAYPFLDYFQLNNIQFNAFVDQVVFKEALKSNEVSEAPKSILMMQDSRTRAAYWDGSVNRHLDPSDPAFETPIGMWMEFVGGRLWVSNGVEILASDIANPLSFTENTYLTGGSLQAIDGQPVTGLARTADAKNLLAFTNGNTTIIQAGITKRSTWPDVANFVSLLFPGVGCVGGKSILNLNGELWWFSQQGARSFTQVGSAIQTSRNAISSNEMKRSFENISPFLNRACGLSCGTYLGFSVPSGDQFNRHTWVLDTSVADLLGSDSAPCWQGVWMGTRPVEWANINVNGKSLCYFLSQERDGTVAIYEAFSENGEDDLFSSIESGGMYFDSPLSFKQYQFTEIHPINVSGRVNMTCEFKGEWGCWKENMNADFCVDKCIPEPSCDLPMVFPNPENRFVRTQQLLKGDCGGDFGSPYNLNVSTYFQNRIRWTGKAGVRAFKSHVDQFEEKNTGQCDVSDDNCKSSGCCDEEIDYITKSN